MCSADAQCGNCQRCVNGRCQAPPCPKGQHLDWKTCKCTSEPICRSDKDCGLCGKCLPNGTCQRMVCPLGQQLDPKTCKCKPVAGPCTSDAQCGRCGACVKGACKIKQCPVGQKLDGSTCQCVPVQCGPCEKPVNGKCVRIKVDCKPGFRLNPITCKCDPVASCANDRACGLCREMRKWEMCSYLCGMSHGSEIQHKDVQMRACRSRRRLHVRCPVRPLPQMRKRQVRETKMRSGSEAQPSDLQVRADSSAALRFRRPMRTRKGLPQRTVRGRAGTARVHN